MCQFDPEIHYACACLRLPYTDAIVQATFIEACQLALHVRRPLYRARLGHSIPGGQSNTHPNDQPQHLEGLHEVY